MTVSHRLRLAAIVAVAALVVALTGLGLRAHLGHHDRLHQIDYSVTRVPNAPRWHLGFVGGPTRADLHVDHGLRLDAAGASYMWTINHDVVGAEVAFRFEPGSSDSSGVNLSFSQLTDRPVGPQGVYTNSLHTTVHDDKINVGVFTQSGLVPLTSIPADFKFGKSYTVTIHRTTPDSVSISTSASPGVHSVTDSRISKFFGSTVGIEHFRPVNSIASDSVPIILGLIVTERY